MEQEQPALVDLEAILDVRAQLKKWQEKNSEQIVSLLKQIKSSRFDRRILIKTKISKTIVRMALFQYPKPDYNQAKITQLAQFLVNNWRRKLFNKTEKTFPDILYKKENNNASSSAAENKTAKSEETAKPSEQKKPQQAPQKEKQEKSEKLEKQDSKPSEKNLPPQTDEVKNTRTRGRNGILKFFKNPESKGQDAVEKVCKGLEEFLYTKFQFATNDKSDKYQSNLKNLCKYIISEQGEKVCKQLLNDELSFSDLLKKI